MQTIEEKIEKKEREKERRLKRKTKPNNKYIDYGGDDAIHSNKGRLPSKSRIIYRRYIDGD